jgi:dynein heavy chain
MYEYSLQMFTGLFRNAILKAEQPEEEGDVLARLEILNDYLTYSVYQNICRSLFEKHKLLFSFSLAIKILQGDNKVNELEWRFLLSGQSTGKSTTAKPTGEASEWITDQMWSEIQSLCGLEAFKGFETDFAQHLVEWKAYYDCDDCVNEGLPGGWDERVGNLQRLCVLRCVRPDKVSVIVSDFRLSLVQD